MYKNIILILSCSLFFGCASHPTIQQANPPQTNTHDGAPNIAVDLNQIQMLTPRSEPLSRYGNHSPYTVLGKTYHVWATGQKYQENGIASWYGTKFHGQHTSSWEPYDMLAMTAAHKHLPLPSFVQVTNLANHKTVIVRVNDRGPFHDDRIIDLSYAAALKLDFADMGTANVRIETLTTPFLSAAPLTPNAPRVPAVPTMPTVPDSLPAKSFEPSYPKHSAPPVILISAESQLQSPTTPIYIQAGAFADKKAAHRLKTNLSTLTDTPIQIVAQHHNEGIKPITLHKVQIGPLYTLARAKLLNQLIRDSRIAEPIILTEPVAGSMNKRLITGVDETESM